MKIIDLLVLHEGSAHLTKDFINTVKNLYDNGLNLAEIAQQIYQTNDKRAQQRVQKILSKHYPDRKIRGRYGDDEKQAVKAAYDNNLTIKQIAQQVFGTKTATGAVEQILSYWYPDRVKRDSVYSDLQIQSIKQMYDQGLSYKQMAKEVFGQDTADSQQKIAGILNRYYLDRPKRRNVVADTIIDKAAEMFASGSPLSAVAAELAISRSYLGSRLAKLSNYETEILPAHLENRERLSGKSNQEVQFFKTLSNSPDFPKLQFNVRLQREGRLYYNVDGLDPDRKIAIEFFGTLWHADPQRFTNGNTPLPKTHILAADIWRKDAEKINWLKSKGYLVLVVWEREWTTKNLRLSTINKIREAFGLKPVTSS